MPDHKRCELPQMYGIISLRNVLKECAEAQNVAEARLFLSCLAALAKLNGLRFSRLPPVLGDFVFKTVQDELKPASGFLSSINSG